MTDEYLLKRSNITKIKIIVLSIISLVIISLIYLLHYIKMPLINNIVICLRYAVFCSLLAFVIVKLIVYIKMITNIEYLKQKEIYRIDERNILIKLKASSITLKTILLTMGCTTIISSFFNIMVFYSQLISFVTFLIVHIIIRFCYNKVS